MSNDRKNREEAGRVEYLDHTADAMFRAYGRTLEEAFAAAAHALCGLMWEPDEIAAAKAHPVEVSGRDLPQLLVAFLEEILFRLDAEGFLTREAAEVRIETTSVITRAPQGARGEPGRHGEEGTDVAIPGSPRASNEALVMTEGDAALFRLTAVLRGDNLMTDGAPRYATHGDVKAVTYNQIRVERDPKNRHWMVQAVVDM